jgi:hypothetical protein
MKFTQFELLCTGLKALPVITTLGGVGVCILFDVNGYGTVSPESDKFMQYVIRDAIICGAMGLLGGVVVACFGHAALFHVNVEEDPRQRARRRAGGPGGTSTIVKFYDKSDVQDNNKSTEKVSKKYAEKEKAAKVERSQILEMGTEGIAQKKREQLGIKPSSVTKPGASQVSAASKPGTTSQPGTASKPGTISKPGTVSKPGTISKPGIVSKPGVSAK